MEHSEQSNIADTPKSCKTSIKDNMDHIHTPQNKTYASDFSQTPRRSSRKSIRPAQDYNEIVNRHVLRSSRKIVVEGLNDKNTDESMENEKKWTPAEVGRVSAKRGKKSRRSTVKKQNKTRNLTKSFTEISDGEASECALMGEEDNRKSESNNPTENKKDIIMPPPAIKIIITNEKNVEESVQHCSLNKDVVLPGTTNLNGCRMRNSKIEQDIVDDCSLNKDAVLPCTINLSDCEIHNSKIEQDIVDHCSLNKDASFPVTINLSDCEIHNSKIEQNIVDHCSLNKDASLPATINLSDCEIQNPKIESEIVDHLPEKQLGANINCLSELGIQPLGTAKGDSQENVKHLKMNEEEEEMPSLLILDDDDIDSAISSSQNSLNGTFVVDAKSPVKIENNETEGQPENIDKNVEESVSKTNTGAVLAENRVLSNFNVSSALLTKLQPKDIVLRSIRKRSLSISVDSQMHKRQHENRVKFYSPANETVFIEDIDSAIATKVRNETITKVDVDIFQTTFQNVTQRRKRSLSCNDLHLTSNCKLQSKIPVRTRSPLRSKQTPQKTGCIRTKVPNFAAIHQKNFKKMESIVDHVARKNERAKQLMNSATKSCTNSVQKSAKRRPVAAAITLADEKQLKARKKIDLSMNNTPKKGVELRNNKKPQRLWDASENEKLKTLPNPKVITPAKNKIIKANSKPSKELNLKSFQMDGNIRQQNDSATILHRPAFNFSAANTTTVTLDKPLNSNLTLKHDDNVKSRQQRHMELFKGRQATAGVRNLTHKTSEYIKGVRSNRRFDLIMQHRRNVDRHD